MSLRCDFCNASNPAWSCPCDDSRTLLTNRTPKKSFAWQDNIGEWLACDACLPHIIRGDPRELAKRCVQQWFINRGEDPDEATIVEADELFDIIFQMQKAYWDYAQGNPTLLLSSN